ncbi:MAG: nucleotidyltransferase family protein [Candidatus Paceibacterota bacterium]|jgi:hypothetical protein
MENEDKILELIKNDNYRMDALRAVKSLNLPDWIIGAGFVRNPVWDYLHEYKEQTPLTDIDVAYFDLNNLNEEVEKEYENKLKEIINAEWSVTNQARMSKINNQSKNYISTEDAISHWPETATAIGVKLDNNNKLELIAPHGINDLLNLNLRMTPGFGDGCESFLKRVEKKQWLIKWPKLKVIGR